MTLYEIDKKINAILENDITVDEETGEVLGIDDLDNLEIDYNNKVESIALFIKNLNELSAGIKVEEQVLKSRRVAAEKKSERLLDYLKFILDGSKFETPKCSISYRKSTKIIVDNLELIDKNYLKEVVKIEVNKTEIKNAIKSGCIVDGAHLEDVNNIQLK